MVAVIFSMAILFTSCKETKKEEVKTESHESHSHDADEASAVVTSFQCPMDCEKGKKYAEAGSCPVCKMDLKEQSATTQEHAEGCTCKEGGECTCESGKCKCMAAADMDAKECGKCEPGKCACKTETASAKKECGKCEPGSCKHKA